MEAKLIFRNRVVFGEGEFAEFVVWQVPHPVPPSAHSFKYRLVYVVDGIRTIGFDNERGKGDHRHDGAVEVAYAFRGVDRLMSDFVEAIETWRASHGRT